MIKNVLWCLLFFSVHNLRKLWNLCAETPQLVESYCGDSGDSVTFFLLSLLGVYNLS
jgi:hypothetical protein